MRVCINKVLHVYLGLTQNGAKRSCFDYWVYGNDTHDGAMTQNCMASSLSYKFKSEAFKYLYDFMPGKYGQLRHVVEFRR